MAVLLSNKFETELGTIKTWIQCDMETSIDVCDRVSVTTPSHEITLQNFKLQNDWLKPHMKFDSSTGWRWFIKKINNEPENLILFCQLIDLLPNTTFGGDSGECLDAIEIENNIHQLHIGTEDGEVMRSRAICNDFMPKRFRDWLGDNSTDYSFTEYIDFGFKTTIPKLRLKEKIYFHYLIATNPIKQSLLHPNCRDISTWFAVDRSKAFLDKYLASDCDK